MSEADFAQAFAAFGLAEETVRELGDGGPPGARFHVLQADEVLVGRRFAALADELGESSPLLLIVQGVPGDARLAMWRNALWPLVHVGAVLRVQDGRARRITLSGTEDLEGTFEFEGAVLYGRRTEHVMSPDATVEKFDKNASGWDGTPGGAGYPHFRWMRRLVGRFAKAPAGCAAPLRILDFGCGAGWVGIEAAKDIGGVELSAFDPSPEMVRIAASNAEKEGGITFDGRTGFGEAPPFGGEHGPPFPLVISSGVVSFSPDIERWLDGLASTVAPGGTLVVGDINPGSRGFLRRRRRKPLLPVRELNAQTRESIRKGLESRGFVHLRSGAYQLTRPFPEAMYVNERFLGGVLSRPLLWANRLATWVDGAFGSPLQDRFDSWVMYLERRAD
ncbi:MAG: class I SAM-dependent methyltransferase [Planctomycetota bacterium]|nr:class I SAM-dependent methyltransferase [Planctomycetota bacterium]